MSQNFEKENSTEEINHPVNMNEQDEADELLTYWQSIRLCIKMWIFIGVLYYVIFSHNLADKVLKKTTKIIKHL